MANGADVDIAATYGDTALMLASSKGYVGIVKALISTGKIIVHLNDGKDLNEIM